MTHDYKAQEAETIETFAEISKIDSLPKQAVVNFLFLAEEVDAPFEAAAAALTAAGFVTHIDVEGETVEARTGEMEISAAAIWGVERKATEVALKFGFDPDGWELVE